MSEIPYYLSSMIRREPPLEDIIVPGSTPVVSFGDFRSVRIATLGINPSNQEFEFDGALLSGEKRRLATLPFLRSENLSTMSHSQIQMVIDECSVYFQRNAYSWFKTLDKVIEPGLGVSYFNGSACHLDLVQWSTSDKWSSLSTRIRNILLLDGRPHLLSQLSNSDISVVVVNGAAVWRGLESMNLGKPSVVGMCTFGNKQTCKLMKMPTEQATFVGWSSNLQSQPGANSGALLSDLSAWLKDELPNGGNGQ